MKEELINLRNRIYDLFDKDVVKQEGDIISLYDLIEILRNDLLPYTDALTLDTEKTIKRINFKSIFNRKVPMISRIIPTVRENNTVSLKIYFCDERRYAGEVELTEDFYPNINNVDYDRYPVESICKLLNDNKEKFQSYLYLLRQFNMTHEGYDFEFNNEKNTNNQEIDDGFIACNLNLGNLRYNHATLSSVNDLRLALTKIQNFGVLYDYIEQYNDEIKKKTSVNINDLNPFIQDIVRKSLNKENTKLVLV